MAEPIFFPDLIACNQLTEKCSGWLWLPGMRFRETACWWKPSVRATPHEGVDLLLYRDRQGERCRLPPEARVPAMFPGTVAGIWTDFLAQTLLLIHQQQDGAGWRLATLYAHVQPLVASGRTVAAGEVVARLAPVGASRPGAPPSHLHLSMAWVHPDFVPASFSWRQLWRNPRVRLVDPLSWPSVGE
ncbi:MAG: hypothetical protein BWK76_08530 [Desulfobulbaceae bacterium A2]|nr:MAG: hypothetical protein BWK76_08530 [Desulfobulbaceae bacterium A2]